MNENIKVIVIVLVLVIFGGWFFFSGNVANAPAPGATNQMPVIGSTTPEMVVTEDTNARVTVAYTDAGFSPSSVTIPVGGTVTFVNESSKNMWVASAMHPAHSVYSGTSLAQHCPDTTSVAFDECSAIATGGSYSFTFNKVGDWKYHNHVNASDFGSVVVTP